MSEETWLVEATPQERLEGVARNELDIFGEHCEQAPHQKKRHVLGIIVLLEPAGDLRQPPRDLARQFRRASRRIERPRIGPDRVQPVADFGIVQIIEKDPEAPAIGKLDVVFPQPAEVGIDVEAVADVADDQKRRPAVISR